MNVKAEKASHDQRGCKSFFINLQYDRSRY